MAENKPLGTGQPRSPAITLQQQGGIFPLTELIVPILTAILVFNS